VESRFISRKENTNEPEFPLSRSDVSKSLIARKSDRQGPSNFPPHTTSSTMPPTLENNFANPPNSLPQHAPHEFASSSPGAAFYATSPAGSAHNSASKARKPGIDALEGLRALPEVRPIPWQSGKELPPEKSTESPRSQTRGAFLLSTRGQIRDPPCTHCASGVGRFSVCVSLEGWFHGACATCQASPNVSEYQFLS
jgi:hypothetical protein